MRISILGATGATGSDLLKLALKSNRITEIHLFTRRKLSPSHPKVFCHVVDFNKPELWQHEISGEIVFSCLGTTLKDAGSKEAQFKVDYTYQYEFAQAAKANGVKSFILVSSVMANAKSSFFYTRIKGQLEDAISLLAFPCLIIFRPPSLIRTINTRKSEQISLKILQSLNQIGLFKSAKPMSTESLAQAMLYAAENISSGIHILESHQIKRILPPASQN